MSKQTLAAFAAAVLFVSASLPLASAAPAPPAPADPYGDPLPPGAVARLGTTRLRHNCVSLAWAPDGKTFATAGADGTVRVWDAASGKEVRQLRQTGVYYNSVLFEPDGKRLIAGGTEGGLHLLDAATGREGRTLTAVSQQIMAVAVRPDGGTAATLAPGGGLRVWDLTTGRVTGPVNAAIPAPAFNPLFQQREALAPDGLRYAVWGPDDLLTVRDADGNEIFHAPTQFRAVDGLVFSHDGKELAASSMAASQVAVWDAATGKELRRLDGVRLIGRALAFSPNGKYLAGIGADKAVHVWGATTGKDLRQFAPPKVTPFATPPFTGAPLAFSPDGKTLAAALGLAVHVWDVEEGKEAHEFVGHTAPIDDLRFSPDGRRVLTCGKDAAAGLWDAATGKLETWRTRDEAVFQVAAVAGPDARTAFIAGAHGVVRWDLGGDKPTERPLVTGLPGFVNALTLSADGKTLAGYGSDHFLYVWDAITGKERVKVRNESQFNPLLALSADGGLLAFAVANAPMRVWDVAANREAFRLDGGAPTPGVPGVAPAPFPPTFRNVAYLAFTPDGRSLAAASAWDLVFWEIATGRERLHVVRPNAMIARVAFSPDGSLAAAGTAAGTVLLLDATDGWELAEFSGPAGAVTALAFAPDGRALASAGADGTALIWDVKEWAGRKRPVAELSPEKLSAMWKDLQDDDAGRAYTAVLALAASPKAAAPFLKGKLTAAKGPDAERIARLIKDLDDDQFDVRENSEKDLDKMGADAMPAVRAALSSDPPPESRRRLQGLLDRRKEAAAVSEEVRGGRAVEALERSGAPEAVDVLRGLAKEASDAALKKQAATALERLARKDAAP